MELNPPHLDFGYEAYGSEEVGPPGSSIKAPMKGRSPRGIIWTSHTSKVNRRMTRTHSCGWLTSSNLLEIKEETEKAESACLA